MVLRWHFDFLQPLKELWRTIHFPEMNEKSVSS